MFTVTGNLADGAAYRVGIHPGAEIDEPGAYGIVMGNPDVIALLALHEGHEVQATSTHDALTLTPTDPAAILAALHQHTRVGVIEGDDVPDLDDIEGTGGQPLPNDAVH